MPDLIAFGPYFILAFLGLVPRPGFYLSGHLPPFAIPQFVYALYSISHSLIVFAVVFGIVWLILKKPRLTMLAWAFHIVLDIPTHDISFFPTPFLWPFSHFEVNGVSWAHPMVLVPDIILLVALYAYFFVVRKNKRIL